MNIEIKNNRIFVSFKYDPGMVEQIRQIPGRKWHPETKRWSVPDNRLSRKKLREMGFDVAIETVEIPPLPEYLRPFQRRGVEFVIRNGGRALIADEMGLGKTLQALTYARVTKSYPTVIVCPASLKWNWAMEIRKWMGDRVPVAILRGRKPEKINHVAFIIVNYDILDGWVDEILRRRPQLLILDECHFIKNPRAKRTAAARKLARKIPKVIALTGTPIINKPIEIFPTLNILQPDVFKSRWKFAERYCGLRYNGFGWDMSGHSNEDELNELLTSTVMIRRTKDQVLRELPEKTRTVIPVEIDLNRYIGFENELLDIAVDENGVLRFNRSNVLAQIAKMRAFIGEQKIPHVLEFIADFRENNPNKKLVVFGWHKSVLNQIYGQYKNNAVLLTGDTPTKTRGDIVQRFQTDPDTWLFVSSIRAGGVGITLTAADTVVFAELGWTPSEHDQAEDRCHRIGQKNPVNIYYIVGRETIDEFMAEIIDQKREIISKIVDGKPVSADTILMELLEKLTEKRLVRQ